MTLTPRGRDRLRTAAGLAMIAALLTACTGTTSSSPELTPTHSPTDSVSATATTPSTERPLETPDPHPRLIVAHDGSATVLNGRNLDVMMTIPIEGIAEPTVSSDDRHVYIASRSGGDVTVLDGGSYALPHVGHAHYYVIEPTVLDTTLPLGPSSRIVSASDHTAMFDTMTGTTTYLNDLAFIAGESDPSTVDGTPHQGVAVPLDGGQLLVSSASDDGSAPSVDRVSASGEVLDSSPECRSSSGVTMTLDAVVFGCEGSVLVYDDGAFRSIPLESGAAQVTRLSGSTHSDVIVTDYGSTEIALIDLKASTVQIVDLGVEHTGLSRGAHGEVAVLGADGAIRVIDPDSGDVTSTIPAIDAFVVDATSGAPQPTLVVMEHLAFVTDVAESRVVAVDIYEGTVLAEVALTSEPYGIVATNTAWLRGGALDHGSERDNEDGHTLDELSGL